ncbi:MAG: DUF3488 and transglutaminase-like domain-containing protein [Desulfobacterota bacterium]|nr:DUF3488 and transglutaminase-like domain-containing protein [Thermodesulfobacteriota bacterium]
MPDRLKLLSVCTSAAGMLCLSLSNLLHWGIFLVLAALHLIVWLRYFDRELIGKLPALGILAAAVAFEAWRISQSGSDGVVPALRDFILMLALTRLFMRKTPREMYQIVGISFSQCMLATIFTVSPLFLVGLSLMVFLVPMTLHALDAHSFSPPSSRHGVPSQHWAAVFLGIILTASMLFYVLPRPASSLFQQTVARQNRFAFSEGVDLKSSGRASDNDAIVMRVLWTSGNPPESFYLSGARLEGIAPDGFFKQETRGSVAPVSNRVTDRLTIYTTSLRSENVFYPYLFHDISPRLGLFRGANLYWVAEPPPRYDLWVSRVAGPSGPGRTDIPRVLSPVAALGLRVAGEGMPRKRVERIARFLMTQYGYSLDRQDIPPGRYGIEWFVLSGRKGSCEHFAAALATMIRGCGIPSRVVTGFLVTEFNKNGQYYIVRVSDAHAWVEYWDVTWHTIDATPPGLSSTRSRFHLLDEFRFRWIRWVIEYSLDDQIHAAGRIFTSAPRIARQVENMTSHALVLLGSGATVLFLIIFIRGMLLPPYEKVRRAFGRKGIHLPVNLSHEEHLAIVAGRHPHLSDDFREYLKVYLSWRFGGRGTDIRARTRYMLARIRKAQKTKEALKHVP